MMDRPIEPARAPEPGPLLFARFALPPNSLGYCGGDETSSLLQHLEAGVVDADLLRQCRDFEGAYPYLQLIAREAGREDPLDRGVVEAYWLGGDALSHVRPDAFATKLTARFRARTARREWPWLLAKAVGAVPHHSFHVLEVLPRIGLLRGGIPPALIPVLEHCLVRPATVRSVERDTLVVAAPRLVQIGRRLDLFESGNVETVEWRPGGIGLLEGPKPGDRVAVHWGWACTTLSTRQARTLDGVTVAALARANETF